MSVFSNRVNDAYQGAKNLNSLIEEQIKISNVIDAAEKVLSCIKNHEKPNSELLDLLELGSTRGYVLRIRLRSLLRVKKRRLQKINMLIKEELEILKTIAVCPFCNGSGEKRDQSYERFGRQIHTTISTENCEHCGGSGQVDLGKGVELMVAKVLKRVSDH